MRYSVVGLTLFAVLMYFGLRNDLFGGGRLAVPWLRGQRALGNGRRRQDRRRRAVVVQSMTLTKTHDVAGDDGADRGARERRLRDRARRGAEERGRRRAAEDRALLADPGDRRHPFQREPRAAAIDAGVAAVRINPGNIGGADKVEQVVRAAKAKGIPMRIGANSGSLPKHLEGLAQQDQAEALVEAALEEVRLLETPRLPRLQDLGQVEPRADDDPRLPAARRQGAVPAASRRHRGGHAVLGLDQERGRHGRAARRRHRRHDPRLAHRRPGRGGEDRLRDPEGARPARARAGDDRVPELRPRQRRRAAARRAGRGAARARIRRRSRSRCSAVP